MKKMKNLLISKVETVKFYRVDHFNNPVNVQHVITFCAGHGRHEGNVVYDIKFTMVDGTFITWIYKDVDTRNRECREIKANFGHMLGEGGFW